MRYVDMHCHPGFLRDAPAFVERAGHDGMGLFANTVLPSEFERLSRDVAACAHARVGLGLHPWWIANGEADEREIALFERHAAKCSYIGEIGLDFGKRFAQSRDLQISVLRRILSACASTGVQHVISFHSSGAAGVLMDEVERACLPDAICIFHWFSGSSDELVRARDAGWYFSVGERMLATKRGKAYLSAIPANRLLLETDFPSAPGSKMHYDAYCRSLRGVAKAVAAARGEEVVRQALETSCRLLDLNVVNHG